MHCREIMLGPNSEEASKMKNVCRVFLPTLACLTLIAPVWALPPTTIDGAAVFGVSNKPNTPLEQTVSGQIASVEKRSFTPTLGKAQTSSENKNILPDPATPPNHGLLPPHN